MDKLIFRPENHISHAYMLASASEAETEAAAKQLAAAMLCSGTGDKPCGLCRNCRKVASGVHPDLMVVEPELDDKGNRRREIYIGQVRAMVSDAQVMPNEADRKVYVIKSAQLLNIPAQNAMLKLLEEPPGNACFILCCTSTAGLLPTLRSRCAFLRSNGEAPEDGEAAENARQYLTIAAGRDRGELLRWCTLHEGMTAAEAAAFVSACRTELADTLCGRGTVAMSPKRCAQLDALFARCMEYLRSNTGTRHIFGLLAVDGIGGNQID